jgi:hypothetical protein
VRLVWISLLLFGALLLILWNPVTTPGPLMCGSRMMLGLPCPLCGGTRAAALMLRGDLLAATAYNPLAPLVVVCALLLGMLWSFEYLSSRRCEIAFSPMFWSWATKIVIVLILLTWIYLLIYRREDNFADSLLGRIVSRVF